MVNASGSDLLTPAVVTCYGSKAGLANQAGLAYGRLTNGTGLSENSETRRIRTQKLTSPPTSARVPRGRAPMFVWRTPRYNFEMGGTRRRRAQTQSEALILPNQKTSTSQGSILRKGLQSMAEEEPVAIIEDRCEPGHAQRITAETPFSESAPVQEIHAAQDTSVQYSEPVPVVSHDDMPHMGGWQRKRLSEIARSLEASEPVSPITVRGFLNWFWYSQRRGRWITSWIRDRLEEAGLRTVPDFESTYLDAEITFELATEEADPKTEGQDGDGQAFTTADLAETRTSPPSFADPTYRISKLAAANRTPIAVKPDASLTEAVTLMMTNDFSQLPVMGNEREVKGLISWQTIGTRLALGQAPKLVREAMDPHAEVSSEASLFTAIPIIVEQGYALVRSAFDKKIVGIITTSDLSLQFQQLSEPFLLLGEIENHLRRIVNPKFTCDQLAAVKDGADSSRSVQSVADLTFGEFKRLLEEPSRWGALHLDLDRAVFIELLEKVRVIRNEVMHFDPDGIEDESLATLRDFVKFLRTLQTIGAT